MTSILQFPQSSSIVPFVIPDSVTNIGGLAFWNCENLKDVKIGRTVTKIGSDVFHKCSSLSILTSFNPKPPLWGWNTGADKELCVLQVPTGSKEAYAIADGWKDFKNVVEIDAISVNEIVDDEPVEVVGYYSADGIKIPEPRKGVNIILYSDGTKKKVLIK